MNILHTRYFIAYDKQVPCNYVEGSVDIIQNGVQFMWDMYCPTWNHKFSDIRYNSTDEALQSLECALYESFMFWCYIQPQELWNSAYPYN